MPDQTVKVTFTAPSTFTFDKEATTMTAAGKINFHRDPGSAAWTFVSVNGLPSPEYTSSVTGNGSGLTVNDGHTTNGSSGYTVTVNDATGNHTSQVARIKGTTPPMIINR
ncbi:MAG: hypothetical protein ACHQRL_02045 [Gemmatimonadales bacterium]|jgi:hypothetical protein